MPLQDTGYLHVQDKEPMVDYQYLRFFVNLQYCNVLNVCAGIGEKLGWTGNVICASWVETKQNCERILFGARFLYLSMWPLKGAFY